MTSLVSRLFPGENAESLARLHWGERWLHGKPGAACLSELLGGPWTKADWESGTRRAMAAGRPLTTPVRVRNAEGGSAGSRILTVARDQIKTLLEAGHTLIGQIDDDRITRLAQAFQSELGLAGDAATCSSRSPAGQAAPLHYDAPHGFILQIEGRKQWTLSRGPIVAAPAQTRHVHPDGSPDLGEGRNDLGERFLPGPFPFDTIVLEPGDTLYVPAGVAHPTVALDQTLSIMIDLTPPPFVKVLSARFRTGLDLRPENLGGILAAAQNWLGGPDFA